MLSHRLNTICFTPVQQLPKATEFQVTVPAGFAAANGVCLTNEQTITMRTQAPRVLTVHPPGKKVRVSTLPMFLVHFNMPIDPQHVIKNCSIKLQGSNDIIPVKLASDEQIERNIEISHALKQFANQQECILVLVSCDFILPQKSGELVISEGVQSLEGPILSQQKFSTTFKTENAFDVTSASLYSNQDDVVDFGYIHVIFTQYVNQEQQTFPTISPALAGYWDVERESLYYRIQERAPLATRFVIKVPKTLQCESGCGLPSSKTFTVETTRPECHVIEPLIGAVIPLEPTVILRFTQAIEVSSLSKKVLFKYKGKILSSSVYCNILDPDEHPELEGNEIAFKPSKPLPPGTLVTLSIKEGIRPLEGNLSSTQTRQMNFNTVADALPVVARDLAIKQIDAPNPFMTGDKMILVFSSPVTETEILSSHQDQVEFEVTRSCVAFSVLHRSM